MVAWKTAMEEGMSMLQEYAKKALAEKINEIDKDVTDAANAVAKVIGPGNGEYTGDLVSALTSARERIDKLLKALEEAKPARAVK